MNEKPVGLILLVLVLGGCILLGSAAGLGLIPALTVASGAAAENDANREREWQATQVAAALAERYDNDFSPGEALDLAESIMEHDEKMQSDALDTVERVAISGDAAQATASIAQTAGYAATVMCGAGLLVLIALLVLRPGGRVE